MNNKLIMFLKKCGVAADAIDEIYAANPQMFMGNNEEIVKNISLVIEHGFPDYEIGELLLLNSSFVFSPSSDLECRLSLLGENVYEMLISNPNLI